jgi:hypothetical protein
VSAVRAVGDETGKLTRARVMTVFGPRLPLLGALVAGITAVLCILVGGAPDQEPSFL